VQNSASDKESYSDRLSADCRTT